MSPVVFESRFKHDDVALNLESLNWMKRLAHAASIEPGFRFLANDVMGSGLDMESLVKIFNHVKSNFPLALSPPGKQEILDWHALVKRGKGKCTDTALFIAAALKTRGIPVKFRAIKRPGDTQKFGHVYARGFDRQAQRWVNLDTQTELGVATTELDFMEARA